MREPHENPVGRSFAVRVSSRDQWKDLPLQDLLQQDVKSLVGRDVEASPETRGKIVPFLGQRHQAEQTLGKVV